MIFGSIIVKIILNFYLIETKICSFKSISISVWRLSVSFSLFFRIITLISMYFEI